MTDVAERLARVRQRIADAIRSRGPGPQVRLVGVSKRQPLERIRAALAAGLGDLAENYAQELRDKLATLGQDPPTWHFVGALQSNKAKHVVGSALIHTVDRSSLLREIHKRAAASAITQDVLVEVNLAKEPQKAGVPVARLPALLDAFAGTDHVRCIGLMIIPPADPQESRRWFRRLRELRDTLAADTRPNVDLRELSMGMSSDFEAAILEGSTLVRVGTAIFGPRTL